MSEFRDPTSIELGLANYVARLTDSAVGMIAAERQRQVVGEQFDASHDDAEHDDESLALAAAMYAMPSWNREGMRWPWRYGPGFKPGDRVRELVKAGALIAAELDRLERGAR